MRQINPREAIDVTPFDAATAKLSFVLAMADATAALLVPPLIRQIESDAPGVSLRVLPLTTRDPRALLESAEVDLAIGYFPGAMAAITLQAALGILTLLNQVPIDLALAHQAVAIVVLTLAVLQTERLVARRVEHDRQKLVLPLGQPG